MLTGQPARDAGQIRRNQSKLAMSVGGHYRIDEIMGRHFKDTAARARIAPTFLNKVFDELQDTAPSAFENIVAQMPTDFPETLPCLGPSRGGSPLTTAQVVIST